MIERLARLGYAAKALIYVIVGLLAGAAALNRGGQITDTSGALRVILSRPLGNTLLVVLGVGLCGYAVWRLLDAFFDPDRHGTDAGGLFERIGNVVRGTIYGALGVEAFQLARGLRGSSGDDVRTWTARIMDLPFGDWLLGIVGLIVAVYGVSQIVTAVREKIGKLLDVSPIPRGVRNFVLGVCRFGVGARAVIIVVLGVFLVRAAIQHDPSEAVGTRESILELVGAWEGPWILAAIAAGLVAYGVDQAVHARYRRIRPVI